MDKAGKREAEEVPGTFNLPDPRSAERSSQEHWAMCPFAAGYIKRSFGPDEQDELRHASFTYGSVRPYSSEKIAKIEQIIRGRLTLANLRAFLKQKCNVQDAKSLTWREVESHLEGFSGA